MTRNRMRWRLLMWATRRRMGFHLAAHRSGYATTFRLAGVTDKARILWPNLVRDSF